MTHSAAEYFAIGTAFVSVGKQSSSGLSEWQDLALEGCETEKHGSDREQHKNSTTTAVPSVGTGKSDGAEAGLVYALAAAVILAAILREMRARNGDSEYGESEDNDKKSEDGKDSMSNSASAIETHELNVADTVFGGTLGSATDNSRAPTADELGPALDCPANGQEGVDGAGTTSDVSTETGVGYDDDDGEGKQKRQK
ncbi:hypothetical protein BGZ54_003610 [Gamsiella multidivaricata]|nr:hypothetical protein BGZ54_003610 [Gamsiella multidivaricata]